jgi:hypothetical protein
MFRLICSRQLSTTPTPGCVGDDGVSDAWLDAKDVHEGPAGWLRTTANASEAFRLEMRSRLVASLAAEFRSRALSSGHAFAVHLPGGFELGGFRQVGCLSVKPTKSPISRALQRSRNLAFSLVKTCVPKAPRPHEPYGAGGPVTVECRGRPLCLKCIFPGSSRRAGRPRKQPEECRVGRGAVDREVAGVVPALRSAAARVQRRLRGRCAIDSRCGEGPLNKRRAVRCVRPGRALRPGALPNHHVIGKRDCGGTIGRRRKPTRPATNICRAPRRGMPATGAPRPRGRGRSER